MTVITVTTVGYREVHDLSRAGQVFTVALIVSGVGTVLLRVHAARRGGRRGRTWTGAWSSADGFV